MPSGAPDMPDHLTDALPEKACIPPAVKTAGAPAGLPARESAALTRHPERTGLRFTVVPRWCVRAQGADCTRCVEACPHGAIALTGATPEIDPAACTDCGLCQGVCDAFSSTERTVQDAAVRVLRAAARGDAVYVACEDTVPQEAKPAANTVALPCLAAGCAEFWALALTAETPVVAVCDLSQCAACEKAGEGALDMFSHAIEQAQAWTGRSVGFAEEAPLERTLVEDYARNSEFDRRGIFRKLAVDATEAANGTRRAKTSTVLQDFQERQERLRATARLSDPENGKFDGFGAAGFTPRFVSPRERMLEQACERLPCIAERMVANRP